MVNKFVLNLDPEMPGKPVYLGVGVSETNERLAVIAVQLRDPDIMVVAFDPWSMKRWLSEERKNDLDHWLLDVDVLRQAIKDVESDKPARFTINDLGNTIHTRDGMEVIATSSLDFPFKVAVCEVVGAQRNHIPSVCITKPNGGGLTARRLQGHLRPN